MRDMTRRRTRLGERGLTYLAVGATHPESEHWRPHSGGLRFEKTVRIGAGDACWQAASSALLSWGVKTRSGFTVEPSVTSDGWVRLGERYWLVVQVGPLTVREPVQVTAVVDQDNRRGFAYGTLAGHPVAGEEAFVVHRDLAGTVFLTLRSLTWPGKGWWRAVFPVVLIAQRLYRRRYLRALP